MIAIIKLQVWQYKQEKLKHRKKFMAAFQQENLNSGRIFWYVDRSSLDVHER